MVDEHRSFRLGAMQRTTRVGCHNSHQPCGRLPDWHVVATTPNRQFECENALEAAGWRVFHPLHLHRSHRNPPRIVSLFPGYLFVPWVADTDWTAVARMQYVWRILMTEPGKPGVVPAAFVEHLQARLSPRRIVDDPECVSVNYKIDTNVMVVDGPLAGLQGLVKTPAGHRVGVLLSMLGRSVLVDFAPMEVMSA